MRLIDADIMLKKVQEQAIEHPACSILAGYASALITEAPTVDAVPVVHGHWILERSPNGKPYCFHCSVCDDDFHHIGIKSATDYCPNCGADMRGDHIE